MNTAHRLAMDVLDVLHTGDTTRLDTLVSADFVDHGAPPWMPPGRAGYATTMTFLHDVMRIRYETHEIVAEGHKVAILATAHGLHVTDHLGFPATGKPFAMPTMHLYLERDGLLVEHWGVQDELQVLWQVGALPLPAPPPALAGVGATPAGAETG